VQGIGLRNEKRPRKRAFLLIFFSYFYFTKLGEIVRQVCCAFNLFIYLWLAIALSSQGLDNAFVSNYGQETRPMI
jgi:hypothetical protein